MKGLLQSLDFCNSPYMNVNHPSYNLSIYNETNFFLHFGAISSIKR